MAEPHSEAARIMGERVRSARQRLALSQEEAAEVADLHVTNFGKIERGKANPTVETLWRLAYALDIDAGVLIDGIPESAKPFLRLIDPDGPRGKRSGEDPRH